MTDAPRSGPKTFARGLLILEALWAAGSDGMKVTEIAAATGVQRPTVYRFLEVLVSEGYAESGPDRVFVFNSARFASSSPSSYWAERFKPVLRRISAQTGDASFLVRRVGPDALCVHRELGDYPIQVLAVAAGHSQPLGVGSAGLALMAGLPKDEIESILAANKDVLPKFGRMTVDNMRHLIRTTQERGWSAIGNAAAPGVLGVGLPVKWEQGKPVCAISVSSVIRRMPLKRQQWIVGVIQNEVDSL